MQKGQTQVLILAGAVLLIALAGGIFFLGRISAPKPQTLVATPSPQPSLTPQPISSSSSTSSSSASGIRSASTVEQLIELSQVIADVRVERIWLSSQSETGVSSKYTPYLAQLNIERSFKTPSHLSNLQQLIMEAGQRVEIPDRNPPFVSDNIFLKADHRYRLFLERSSYRPFLKDPSVEYYAPASGQVFEIVDSKLLPYDNNDPVSIQVLSLSPERLIELIKISTSLPN